MYFVGSVLQVLAVVAFIGSVLSDGEGGELGTGTTASGGQVCGIPLESGESPSDLPVIILDLNSQCWREHKDILNDNIRSSNTTEELKVTFKNFCEITSTKFIACVDEIAVQAEHCVNETQIEVLRVDRDYFKKLIRVGCVRNGERLVTITEEGRRLKNNTVQNDAINRCFSIISQSVQSMSQVDPLKRSEDIKSGIIAFRECFLSLDQEANIFATGFVSFMDEMLV